MVSHFIFVLKDSRETAMPLDVNEEKESSKKREIEQNC